MCVCIYIYTYIYIYIHTYIYINTQFVRSHKSYNLYSLYAGLEMQVIIYSVLCFLSFCLLKSCYIVLKAIMYLEYFVARCMLWATVNAF
jgi:hypothetical protein